MKTSVVHLYFLEHTSFIVYSFPRFIPIVTNDTTLWCILDGHSSIDRHSARLEHHGSTLVEQNLPYHECYTHATLRYAFNSLIYVWSSSKLAIPFIDDLHFALIFNGQILPSWVVERCYFSFSLSIFASIMTRGTWLD